MEILWILADWLEIGWHAVGMITVWAFHQRRGLLTDKVYWARARDRQDWITTFISAAVQARVADPVEMLVTACVRDGHPLTAAEEMYAQCCQAQWQNASEPQKEVTKS